MDGADGPVETSASVSNGPVEMSLGRQLFIDADSIVAESSNLDLERHSVRTEREAAAAGLEPL